MGSDPNKFPPLKTSGYKSLLTFGIANCSYEDFGKEAAWWKRIFRRQKKYPERHHDVPEKTPCCHSGCYRYYDPCDKCGAYAETSRSYNDLSDTPQATLCTQQLDLPKTHDGRAQTIMSIR
ncbi:hypothetical protein KM043_012913 [Ampulex compressa]|nr:hypothetical protein KM043_012913 [Ampulex compressa]